MKKEVEIKGSYIAAGALALIMGSYVLGGLTYVELHEGAFAQSTMGETAGQTRELVSGSYTWIEPISNEVFTYDTRNKQYEDDLRDITNGLATADGQPLIADLSLDIGLDRTLLGTLHTKYGPNWYDAVVYPLVRSQFRFGTGGVKSDKMYTTAGKQQVADYLNNQLTPLSKYGIVATVNIRKLDFTNEDFKNTLENKAKAKQLELTEQYNAAANIQKAIGVENLAEGEKQKTIKEAEAAAEQLRLEGLGERDKQVAVAEGIEAIGRAKAIAIKQARLAVGTGDNYAKIKVAEALGDNFQVWGIPTGAPGTKSIVGLDSMFGKSVGVNQ